MEGGWKEDGRVRMRMQTNHADEGEGAGDDVDGGLLDRA